MAPSRYWVLARLARLSVGLLLILPLLLPGRLVAQSHPATPALPPATAATSVPASGPAYSLPPDKLAKAKTLNKIRLALDIGGSLWGLAFLWWLLASCAASRLERWACRNASRRWIQGLLFFLAFMVIISLANLPVDTIGHAASRHYGISVQGWGGWLADQGKAFAVSTLAVPVLLLFNWIVRRWPRRYWLGAWIAILPLMVVATIGEPLLEPVFNKYEPLQKNHAALVTQLERVVARTGTSIPPERMFLMKASEKTNGLNAYVSGLGATKRIVVWDTTADRIPDDEILCIFGHESGHYVLHHIAKGLIASAIFLLFVFAVCARLAEGMVRRFGVRWGIERRENEPPVATRTGFVALIFVVSIVMFLLEPMGNTLSRYFEHQADVYGQEAIHGLVPDPQKTAVSSFNHLGEAWLEDPDPNPFVEFWLYSHPSVQNRARFAAHYNPWANGGHGEFFSN